jgi:hypothetical protein
LGAAITTQKHTGGQPIEVSKSKPMAPQAAETASRADLGMRRPRIISLTFEKLLEIDQIAWFTSVGGSIALDMNCQTGGHFDFLP